ncbi:hypothetical protein KSP40_PGU010554 [Platanthera guangdongensis]|uniref:Xaa-Pro dipeptidase n=1 Tax=Platanthera guangdongensis TaxID=2320717 RepID=A0ABR2M1C4_9ASPA
MLPLERALTMDDYMPLSRGNRDKDQKTLNQARISSSFPLARFRVLTGGVEHKERCTQHGLLLRLNTYKHFLSYTPIIGQFFSKDVASGHSILFAPRLSAEYAVWLGEIKPLSYFKERYMVDMTHYVDEIAEVLYDLGGQSGKQLLFLLHGLNTDSNNFSRPADFKDIENFETDLLTLHPILTECRVFKSNLEVDLIQYANDVSSEAHIEVMRRIGAGMKEYQLESIFLHHIYMHGGCRHCSYTCICATGENSAVLHYGHAAAPNDRTLKEGDIALFDMGAEYHFYGSDITCSFPVNGKFTKHQAVIYNAVLRAHDTVIKSISSGVSWIDMHKLAEKTILQSLKTVRIIVGDIDEMMEMRLGAVFLPHGIGHLLGIDTHDPGGYTQGMERPKVPGLKSLRTIRELREGMVITVEPGCYFIDALLNPALEDPTTSRFFNVEELDRYKNFGGIRIESDVVVTLNGCRNLTNVPREIWEIEAVMAGEPWPLKQKQTPLEPGLEPTSTLNPKS